MSHSNRFIILGSILLSTSAFAIEVSCEPFYWRATESFDWVLYNDLNPADQKLAYHSIRFDYDPGFKIGFKIQGDRDVGFYYTWYHTKAHDTATGNVRSQLLPAVISRPNGNYFYQSGEIDFSIDYNMFDVDFSQRSYIGDRLILNPMIGLKGGWIHQKLNTQFQGAVSVSETTTQHFTGVGPKTGLESTIVLFGNSVCRWSFVTDFTGAFMWGHWSFKDMLNAVPERTISVLVNDRHFGSLSVTASLGIHFDYQCFSAELGYEIEDWFDQFQILDDGTGGHNSDMILQGFTLKLAYEY